MVYRFFYKKNVCTVCSVEGVLLRSEKSATIDFLRFQYKNLRVTDINKMKIIMKFSLVRVFLPERLERDRFYGACMEAFKNDTLAPFFIYVYTYCSVPF